MHYNLASSPGGFYLGLDLTSSPDKASSAAILDELPRLVVLLALGDDASILEAIRRQRPAVVAIDAPLSLPLGLDCLEEAHDCRPLTEARGRQCERQLSQMGIGSYYTTKRSILKAMVYRGVALKRELSQPGLLVIEVYPYASRRVLFPHIRASKGTAEGRRLLQGDLRRTIRGLAYPRSSLLSHHQLDALLAAHTGYLFAQGRVRGVGDPAEGLIYIPAQCR